MAGPVALLLLVSCAPCNAELPGAASAKEDAVCYAPATANAHADSHPADSVSEWEPWEFWRTEHGYSHDRRLELKVSVRDPHLTIADLLAAVQKQTAVRLVARESELQGQELTVFARDLPLNALMVQMADLLGLYWYQQTVGGETIYTVTYGSSPPAVSARAEEAYWREVRSRRIADYVRATSLSPAELQALSITDPMLVRSMQSPSARRAAFALAQLAPAKREALAETGGALLTIREVQSEYEQLVREDYAAESDAWNRLGVPSADALVDGFRLVIRAPGETFSPFGGQWHRVMYMIYGSMWPGLHASGIVLAGRTPMGVGTETQLAVPDRFAQVFLALLYGKLDEPERVGILFPTRGKAETLSQSEQGFVGLARQGLDRHRQRFVDSPWKDDPRLARSPQFDLSHKMKVTEILQAVSSQTEYSVIGTYFEDHDPQELVSWAAEKPLYELLNNVAVKEDCSWARAGSIVRWKHNRWIALQSERRGR